MVTAIGLPVGIGNEDFEVEGSRNGLIADHAWYEAVLAYSVQDALIQLPLQILLKRFLHGNGIEKELSLVFRFP